MTKVYRDSGNAPINLLRVGSTDTLAFTASADNTAAYVGDGHIVRLVATQDCHVAIGASATAVTTDMFLPAGVVEFHVVNDGERVSAVQEDTGGNLFVTDMDSV